jgi:RimJ/RimL family protein N-acetyltransferase
MILKKYKIFDKTIILRYPRPSDAQDLMNLINSLVKEGADIAKAKPVTIEEEKIWLKDFITSIKNKEKIIILAEMDSVCVGSCEVTKDAYDVSRHVGTLGIGIIKQARGIGIGTTLIKTTLDEAKKKLGLELVKLYVFDSNNIGRSIYAELGFKEIGRIPKGVYHNKKYKDDIIMAKTL